VGLRPGPFRVHYSKLMKSLTPFEILQQYYIGKKIKLYNGGRLQPYLDIAPELHYEEIVEIIDVVEVNSRIEYNPFGIVLLLKTSYGTKRLHFYLTQTLDLIE